MAFIFGPMDLSHSGTAVCLLRTRHSSLICGPNTVSQLSVAIVHGIVFQASHLSYMTLYSPLETPVSTFLGSTLQNPHSRILIE